MDIAYENAIFASSQLYYGQIVTFNELALDLSSNRQQLNF